MENIQDLTLNLHRLYVIIEGWTLGKETDQLGFKGHGTEIMDLLIVSGMDLQ